MRTRFVLSAVALLVGCGQANESEPGTCGPAQAQVVEVIDGDTIRLDDGNWVRYLLVDTPDFGGEPECFAAEADAFNRNLVLGQTVRLDYEQPCRDAYGRLLAYVSIDDVVVNERLLARGYACRLYIPPAGDGRQAAYAQIETQARDERAGLWAACGDRPC